MVAPWLTPNRDKLTGALTTMTDEVGSMQTAERIGAAAEATYEGHHHITQLLVRKNLKQCEFAAAVASAFRAGHMNVALALTRTLLEGAIEMSWAADVDSTDESKNRLIRILASGYRAMAEVSSLPDAEQSVVDCAESYGLKHAPDVRAAMQSMDAREVKLGGEPFWESHYKQFALSSDYIHASFLGPGRFHIGDDEIIVRADPDMTEGIAALRWSIHYFAWGASTIARLVRLEDLADAIVQDYAAIKSLAEQELEAVLAPSDE